ncbi:MAG: hypothetical protein HN341_05995 [Verrucomicrobia bacterium]|jgi:hypothetical protein|nr:hypothetical protein [Verrucomicrobiota bacterium]
MRSDHRLPKGMRSKNRDTVWGHAARRCLANGLVCASVLMLALPLRADEVNLTIYNSSALQDSDSATALEGGAGAGDLVQLVLAGPNNTIDPPDGSGNPGGDDTILTAVNHPTHVGAGMTTTNSGFLVQANMRFGDTHVGTNAYIRFWNAATVAGATHYGNSKLLALPAPDAFGEAELDTVPLPSDPRTTVSGSSSSGTLFTFAAVTANRKVMSCL